MTTRDILIAARLVISYAKDERGDMLDRLFIGLTKALAVYGGETEFQRALQGAKKAEGSVDYNPFGQTPEEQLPGYYGKKRS